MVNNSTNINKTNNDLSPQIIELKKRLKYVGNPDPGLRQAQKYGRVKPIIGIPNLPV